MLEKVWEQLDNNPEFILEDIGQELANIYPWKSAGDAVVFIISGRPPRLVEPLTATHDPRYLGRFSISFSPWISEKTVLGACSEINEWISLQLPKAKTLEVLRFVSEQANEEGVLPSWPELLDRWNRAYPHEAFATRSSIRRAYERAVKALVPPNLPLGLE